MAGRIELPAVPPELQSDFPPHIRNHISEIEAARGRSASYSSPSNPSDGSQPSSTSPFFSFLKLHTRSKEDGEKPKRRGPKPDSKPPLTRKQELNRQAQRTHRQRKEFYVKSLEKDVARLREAFTLITKEKTQILQENRRLKELLELHGIVYNPDEDYGYGTGQYTRQNQGIPGSAGTSYDHIGVEFVLAGTAGSLEKPCVEHMIPLTSHAVNNPDADFHGHALCISCPPENHSMQNPNMSWDSKNLDMEVADLSILFNLSNRLQLEGEMTPIAVWATIARHERFAELEQSDFETVKQELLGKVKCHGFGAVIEEFEVSDTLNQFFADKLRLTF